MIKTYLESVECLQSIQKELLTKVESVYIYSEIPGQYFCVSYDYLKKEFKDFTIQSGKYKVGRAIRYFKFSGQSDFIEKIIKENKKRKYFKGSKLIRLFFKYDGVKLMLIDVWNDVCGYIKPADWNKFFCFKYYINTSTFEDIVTLDKNFINSIKDKDYIIRTKNGKKYKI